MNPVMATRADEQTARTYWTMGGGDSERSFRAAIQHSRRVRKLRIVLPAVVIFVVSVLILWTYFNPLQILEGLPVKIGEMTVSGTKITMEAPRLAGYTRDDRPYELTAKSAAQDLKRPDMVELSDIRAKVQTSGIGMTEITARNGTYDSKKETLMLGDDVVLVTTGYRAWMTNTLVDIKTSNVVSEKPVKVEMLKGVLNANRLQISESGDLITFGNGVVMDLKGLKLEPSPSSQPAREGAATPDRPPAAKKKEAIQR
jgi:lipopolysaccharide export system protein LptC